MYCTDRTHLVCGHQFSNCYPLTCTHLALRQCLMKRPPTDLTRLRETGSMLDIWLVPYKVPGGCLSLCISDAKMFATEGPDRGVIEMDGRRCCGMFFAGQKRFSLSKPLAST